MENQGESYYPKPCTSGGEKFYLVYDVTDPYHNIEIGFAYDLNEAKQICKQHCKEFPGSKIQVYEMVRE